MKNITDKMYNKKWGVFTHYLCHCDNWSERVAALDIGNIVDTPVRVKAGYYFITMMQGHKYMLAPNAAYDSIVGAKPGENCAERDVPVELSSELKKHGIDLYLYFTGDGPFRDEKEGKAFGLTRASGEVVTLPFVKKWAQVLEEYAVRYGDKVNGWWIDGCYSKTLGYTEELVKYYDDACKKGNPESLTAFNRLGTEPELIRDYPNIGDFTCGEYNDFVYIPKSRFVDGAQAHILAPLGIAEVGGERNRWCRPGCYRSKEYMLDYIRKVNAAGGVVTIDIVIYPDGSFDPEQIELLEYVGSNL